MFKAIKRIIQYSRRFLELSLDTLYNVFIINPIHHFRAFKRSPMNGIPRCFSNVLQLAVHDGWIFINNFSGGQYCIWGL